jgi:hypothetical protein
MPLLVKIRTIFTLFLFPVFICVYTACLDNMHGGSKEGALYKFSDCWLNSYWLWKGQTQSDMHLNCAWGNGKTKYQNQRATLENHIIKITRMVNWYLEMYTCGIDFMYTTWWTFWALCEDLEYAVACDRFWTSTEFVNNLPMFNWNGAFKLFTIETLSLEHFKARVYTCNFCCDF